MPKKNNATPEMINRYFFMLILLGYVTQANIECQIPGGSVHYEDENYSKNEETKLLAFPYYSLMTNDEEER